MKVLVLSSVYPSHRRPTHGVFVRQRVVALARHCDLRIIAPVPWLPFGARLAPATRPRIERRETQDGLEVYHPPWPSPPFVLQFLDGLLYFLAVWPTARRLHRDVGVDLIDAHFAYPDGFAAVLLGRVLRLPVTITLRGSVAPFARKRSLRPLIAYALRRADRLLAVCRDLAEKVARLGIEPDTITVTGNGVDLELFRPVPRTEARAALGLPMDRRILVSVAHLEPRKGFHRVIGLLPSLLCRVPDLLFVAVGGPVYGDRYLHRLRSLIRDLELEDHVRLAGTQFHDRVPLWLSAADVFCLYTRGEGWANVFLEAMACGKPVVTTRVGGNPEVVASDEVGLLVDLDDEAGMRDALAEALTRDWDAAAIRAYAERHSWERVAERVLPVWEDAIESYRARANAY